MNIGLAKLLGVLEKGFAVLALLLFTGALVPLLRQQGGFSLDVSEGDPIMQALVFGVYAITLPLIVTRWKKAVRVVTREKLLIILVGLVVLSVLWSAAPQVTLRRSVALILTTSFGLYLAIRYSLREQLRLLAWMLTVAVLLSLLFALALPSYGIHQTGPHAGAWRGIYIHKNALGRSLGLGVLVFSLLTLSSRYRWVTCTILFLSVSLLLLSRSATPLLSSIAILSLLPLYSTFQWRYTLAIPFFNFAVIVGGSIAIWIFSNLETVLGFFGRDPTLTGRTELWVVLFEMIQKRPVLGYGYSGFWLGWQGESAYVWAVIPWQPTYAHNGFLELGLDLGLLGISLFVIGFLISFLRAVKWVHANKNTEGLFPLAYLTFTLQSNIGDSIILKQNNIFWILYVATTLSMVIHGDQSSKIKPH